MARTIETIYNEMLTEKQSLASLTSLMPTYNLVPPSAQNPFVELLQNLSSGSKVALWRLFIYIVAVAHHTQEILWDYFKLETESLAKKSIAGNLAWYADQVMKFQFGFALIFDSIYFRYFYADSTSVSAVAARIVKKVSVQEIRNFSFNGLQIKVAKETAPGVLAPLDATAGSELDSLTTYIERIKFAGVQTVVISQSADPIRVFLKVFYDGTLDLNLFKPIVEAAVKSYINGIGFDGIFYTTKIIDALQKVDGIQDVQLLKAESKAYNALLYTLIERTYNPVSGWFDIAAFGTGTNNSQIEYVAV